MALTPGTILGQYEIRSAVGAGGMGEVYRAHDTRLDREVAIKVLPASLASDPDRLRRFEQEARAAAALNHPNILSVYQMATHDSISYLVSELLEGETLRERLRRGPLPFRKAVDYAVQIAHGLAAPHEKGIIHRDLKPDNLFVTKDGRVKILDFGLAKVGQTKEPSNLEVTVTQGTDPGMVMGTIGYMAPEQVRGKTADHRSDIFAFGTVLYELVTGKPTFRKPTSADTMAAILNEEPPSVSQLAPSTPPGLQRIVHRCLEKDPEQRFQSASDLAFALEALSDSAITPLTGAHAQESKSSNGLRSTIVAAVVVITIGAAAAVRVLMPVQQPRVTGSTQLTHDGKVKGAAVTDGSRVYFTERKGRRETLLEQVSLSGGEILQTQSSIKNFDIQDISSDHSQLLVVSDSEEGTPLDDAPLWTLPLPAGSPRRLGATADGFDAYSARWSPDGQQIVFSKGSDLWVARLNGSQPTRIATVQGQPIGPDFSPDGKRIRFTLADNAAHTFSLWEVRADGSNLHPLLPGWHNPPHECCGIWTPDGRYYLFRTTVHRVSFGDIFALSDQAGLFRRRASVPTQLTFGPLAFWIAGMTPDGKKLLVGGYQSRGELVRYDPTSKQFVPFLGGISAYAVAFSRDGEQVAYVDALDDTLWMSRADGSEKVQLTYPPDRAAQPRWSPDGKQIAYMSQRLGKPWKMFLMSTQGGAPEELLPGDTTEGDPAWSTDGTRIAFSHGLPPGQSESDIRILDLKTRQVTTIPGSNGMFSPRWSPDGRYLVTLDLENVSKKLFLYDVQIGKWSDWVTDPDGVGYPAWSSDSRYLDYWSASKVKRIRLGESRPEELFSFEGLDVSVIPDLGPWNDNAADGSRMFLRNMSTEDFYTLNVDLP